MQKQINNNSQSNLLSEIDTIQKIQRKKQNHFPSKPSHINLNQSSIHASSSAIRKLQIPLIARKMNSIQRYIHGFKRQNNSVYKRPKIYLDFQQKNDITIPYANNQINLKSIDNGNDQLNQSKFHLKYRSLLKQQSQSRLENLDKIEEQYVRLKNNIQPHAHGHSHTPIPATSPYGSHAYSQQKLQVSRSLPKKKLFLKKNIQISEEQLKDQIRATKIEQNGKNHYADLYLLKKARDKVISSLQHAGKSVLQNDLAYKKNSLPQQQDIYQKILNKRVEKRNKFIQAKNSHWNVYYDLMALSSKQKKNVKGYQKFMYDYGLSQ